MKKHTTFLFMMKPTQKLLPIVWVLIIGLLTILPSFAQTPQFSKCCGTASSQFPFKNNGGCKTQLWYNPSDFTVLPGSGKITKVYFRSQVAGQSGTYINFKILLKQPASGTQFATSTAFEVGGFTQVLSRASITINGATSIGGWYEIALDNSFNYDNTKPLVIETQFDPPFGGVGIDNYGTAVTTFKKIYAATLTATTGTASNGFWQDFGIDVSPPGGNNASVNAFIGPKLFCGGSQDITVRIKNTGNNILSNVTVKWTLDGVPQPPIVWTAPLDTFGGTTYAKDTAIVLGSVLFGTSGKTLKVWTELPNSVPDTVNADDTLNMVVSPGLNGAYTIGGTTPHFATVSDAVNALNNYGVCGPVTFTVAPNSAPNTNTIAFKTIWGASAVNTITFNGNGNTITSVSSPLVAFSGSSYITLDSFNIIGGAAFAGFGVHFGNQSHHITLNRNKIDVGITGTATTNAGIVVSGSTAAATTAGVNARVLTITNNEVIGGYYGLVFVGSATYFDNGSHTIQNNKIRDFYSYGIYLSNADTVLVANNDIYRTTRNSVTTTYGISLTSCRNHKISNNKLHDFAVASYTAYPIHIAGCVNTTGFETEISNNLIYNIGTTSIMHGINFLTTASSGVNIYYNTIQHEVPSISTAVVRGISLGVAAITNVTMKNNIISIKGAGTTGVKTGIYVTTAGPTIISNNNVIHVNTATASLNNVGFWTAARVTLADWQTASSQDALSVSADPVFSNPSAGVMYPLSINCDNIGTPISSVTTDFSGALRSGAPDPGVFEFTGLAGDIAMVGGELRRSNVSCYSTVDTALITIKNVIGTAVDFSINPLKIVWKVTGPVNTTDSFTVILGTIAPGNSQTYLITTVNMSKPGDYTLRTYLTPNTVNLSTTNDTLVVAPYTIKSILEVTPKTITVTGPADTVILFAQSPLFPRGPFFSEISHFKTTVGQPTTGWPTYLIADDYVEITGVPNSDFAGFVLEDWGTPTTHIFTFPTGTLFSPNGTLILATGQLTTSVPVPASFYYHTGNTATHGSTTSGGYILKNAVGTVIDAVSYGTFAFPASTGVTAADWTGSTTAANSGIRLNGADNNTSSTWINSTTAPQDPNALNSGVTAPPPGTFAGFDWNYLGGSIGTSPKKVVGPYSVPGVYTYVASYTNICGTFYDTVKVTAAATVPVKLVSFKASRANADVNLVWNTASETNNSHFEIEKSVNGKDFTAIGRVKGMGTTSKANRYAYVDARASNTTSRVLYYRLKQVDNNGASTYSRTEVVTLSNKQITGLGTHPNPSNGMFTITADLASASTVNLKVVNIMGATVWNQTMTPVMGANAFDANLQLPDGVYMLVLEQDGETSTQKFVLQK